MDTGNLLSISYPNNFAKAYHQSESIITTSTRATTRGIFDSLVIPNRRIASREFKADGFIGVQALQ